jgi:hypothetical protein
MSGRINRTIAWQYRILRSSANVHMRLTKMLPLSQYPYELTLAYHGRLEDPYEILRAFHKLF